MYKKKVKKLTFNFFVCPLKGLREGQSLADIPLKVEFFLYALPKKSNKTALDFQLNLAGRTK